MAKYPLDSAPVYVAAGMVSGCGALFFNVMPVFVGALADELQATPSQLGDLVAAFNVGFTVAAFAAVAWVRRVEYRIAAAGGVLVVILTSCAMSQTSSLRTMSALSCLLGLSMGSLYALILAVLGDSEHPNRAFGLKLSFETLPGAVLLFAIPAVVAPHWGFDGVVLAMAATSALLGVASYWLPATSKPRMPTIAGSAAGRIPIDWRPPLSLVSSMLFFTGIAASWTFLELLADASGLSGRSVGTTLGVGFIVSGLGGFAAAAIDRRFGRLAPMVAIVLINWLGLWALASFHDVAGYALGACAFLFTVNFGLACTFGLTAEVDARGHFVTLSAAALSIGAVIGPAIGGRLVERAGFGGVLALSALCSLLSLLSYAAVARAEAGKLGVSAR